MAPRRLLAVMVGLLVLSSVAAALVPVQSQTGLDTTDPKDGRTMHEPTLPTGGNLLNESIRLGSGKRPTISARVGDQLALRVSGNQPVTIELVGLGATADADPGTPARFNVLLLQPGRYDIRELGSDRSVGSIQVRSAPADQDPGHGKGQKEKKQGNPGAPSDQQQV